MGFSKNTYRAATSNFADFNIHNLRPFQWRAIAHYVSIALFRQLDAMDNKSAREALRVACALPENATRAQEAYQMIVLGEVPAGTTKVEGNAKAEAVQMLADILSSRDGKMEQGLRDSLKAALEAFTGKFNADVSATIGEIMVAAKAAVKEAANQYRPIVIKEGTKPARKVKGVLPKEFERMVQLASARIPIMLVGPAGCGKTYLCEKLAEALNVEFSDQSCSEGMSESVFNGLLLPIGKGGEFKHVASPFMERYESGGVMLLDEIDAGDANLFTYINKAIANDSYTSAPRFSKPRVTKSDSFILVAAANTFGHGADAMYVGRNQLDAATLDRFKVGLITMDYSREVESSIADEELCAWAWRIRDAIRNNKLRRIMSTRVIKDLSKMRDMYKWTLDECAGAYFGGWSDADKRVVGAN